MNTRLLSVRRCAVAAGALLFASSLVGCAASAKAPSSASAEPPPPPAPAAEAAPASPAQPGYPAPQTTTPPASTATAPGGAGGAPGSRQMALQTATGEVESSQRELDVAAGDCRNACRALGSMDRAAGKVCQLVQGEATEGRRCDDAKHRVYSARDRVKTTCGTCPGGPSVERTDPVPSLR